MCEELWLVARIEQRRILEGYSDTVDGRLAAMFLAYSIDVARKIMNLPLA